MLRPKTFLGPAMLFLVAAAVWSTVGPSRAEPATEECKSKPDAPSPSGSHWYYRINRPDGRHCWYLGPLDRTKTRSAVPEPVSRASAAAPKTRRAIRASSQPAPTAEGTVAEASPADAAPLQADAAPLQIAPAGNPSSQASLGPSVASSAQTSVAVRWPDTSFAPARRTSEAAPMSSRYGTKAAAVEPLESPAKAIPEPSSVAGAKEPGLVRLSGTAITSTLALAFFLATVLLRFARRMAVSWRRNRWEARYRDYWEFPVRAGFVSWCRECWEAWDHAWRQSKHRPRSEFIAQRTLTRPDSPHDFKAGLQQLMRDLRQAEAATEPPRKFEPSARHQLRLLLGKGAAPQEESRQRDFSPTELFLQRRSAAGLG
jgi:hypothetical protein